MRRPNDEELLRYIEAHPDASPQQVLAHFGFPYDPKLWARSVREVAAKHTDSIERLKSGTAADRAWVAGVENS